MKRRVCSLLMTAVMLLSLIPTSTLAVGVEEEGLVSISTLQAAADGTYDHESVLDTNGGHVQYTYYNDSDKMCSHSAKDENGDYLDGEIPWVKTVTITGIAFNQLNDGSEDMTTLQSVIMNGRRQDTPEHFKDSIEVKFENCAFHQTNTHLQVYKIKPCDVTKYTFENCTFTQKATGQYAVTLNATETAYDRREISYEIINSVINSAGRGINITAGTETESLGSHMPSIVIRGNMFTLPAEDDSNMAIQLAGNWDSANLTAVSDPLITVSENSITAYAALRINDNMSDNTTASAKYVMSFEGNILSDGTKGAVTKSDDTSETTRAIAEYYDDQLSDPVAQVNGTTYTSLSAAVAAAGEGETVTLLDDVASDVIRVDQGLTIDLAGFTWTGTNANYVFTVQNDCVVTIKDGTIAEGPAYLGMVSAGNVTLENCTITTKDNLFCHGGTVLLKNTGITATNSNAYAISLQDGTVTIDKDSSITAMGTDRAIGVFIKGTNENSKPVLNVYGTIKTFGSTIQGNGSDRSYPVINIYPGAVLTAEKTAMYLPQPGTVTIDGAVVTGYAAIGMKSGTLNINDSTIHGVANDAGLSDEYSATNGIACDGSAIVIDSYVGYAGEVSLNITGNSLIQSDYSTAIREIGNVEGATNIVSINIESGRFSSPQGKDTILVRDVTKDTVHITDGYFTSDPSEYITDKNLAALPGEYVVDGVTYAYTVGEALPANVEVVAGDTEVDVPTADELGVTEDEQQALNTALENISGSGLTNKANAVASDANALPTAEQALAQFNEKKPTEVAETENVTVVVVPRLEVSVEAYSPSEKTLVLDVKAVYDIKATTDSDDMKEQGADGVNNNEVNTVTIQKNAGTLNTTGTDVVIAIPLPEGFVTSENDKIYVQHKGYEYTANVTESGENGSKVYTAIFTNPHGFSTFTISTKSQTVAAVNGDNYTSFQDAVNAAQSGDTITIPSGASVPTGGLSATISGSASKNVKVENQTNASITVTINGEAKTIGNGGTADFTYTYTPTQGGSGSSGPTRYTVSVPSDIEGGSIKVSPTRASRGQTVTITVKPDEGYVLDEIAVYDADGDEIELERANANQYQFTMPRGKVEIEVSFLEAEEESVLPFRDVDVDDWSYNAVVYVTDAGIMSGVSGSEFAPNATLTRAMIAQMLWALEDKPVVNYLMTYDDVAAGAWYGEAVRWISSQGFMSGYSDAAFGPNDPLTREQLCLILYNYAEWAGYDVSGGVSLGSYLDAGDASAWAVEALEWALDARLISGRGENLLAPAGTATRAEIAQIMMNFLEKVAG